MKCVMSMIRASWGKKKNKTVLRFLDPDLEHAPGHWTQSPATSPLSLFRVAEEFVSMACFFLCRMCWGCGLPVQGRGRELGRTLSRGKFHHPKFTAWFAPIHSLCNVIVFLEMMFASISVVLLNQIVKVTDSVFIHDLMALVCRSGWKRWRTSAGCVRIRKSWWSHWRCAGSRAFTTSPTECWKWLPRPSSRCMHRFQWRSLLWTRPTHCLFSPDVSSGCRIFPQSRLCKTLHPN